jgi:hypothetical protein
MTFVGQEFLDGLAAGVGALVARVAHRNDEAANAFLALFFVFMHGHRQNSQAKSLRNTSNTYREFKAGSNLLRASHAWLRARNVTHMMPL